MKKTYMNYYILALFMLTLLSIIFSSKIIYLAPHLNISISLIIYPITYLILVLMYKKYNVKTVKESIYSTFLLVLVFYLMVSLLNSVDSILSSNSISDSLREIFSPNTISISKIKIYYPDLVNLFSFTLVFFLTHYIFIVTYEAVTSDTNYFFGFTLSLLISFILNQLLYIPLINIPKLIENTIIYKDLIELMAANFIIVVFSSVIIIMIYVIIINQKNK